MLPVLLRHNFRLRSGEEGIVETIYEILVDEGLKAEHHELVLARDTTHSWCEVRYDLCDVWIVLRTVTCLVLSSFLSP